MVEEITRWTFSYIAPERRVLYYYHNLLMGIGTFSLSVCFWASFISSPLTNSTVSHPIRFFLSLFRFFISIPFGIYLSIGIIRFDRKEPTPMRCWTTSCYSADRQCYCLSSSSSYWCSRQSRPLNWINMIDFLSLSASFLFLLPFFAPFSRLFSFLF